MLTRLARPFVLLAAVAAASPPAADALVMCTAASKKSGAVKEGAPIRLRTACKSTETAVDPVALGLQGPAGATGATGATGPQGPVGLSGVELVQGDGAAVVDLTDGEGTATASCPSGKTVVGGGFEIVEDVGDVTSVTKVESRPVGTSPQGWTALVRGNSSDDWHLRAWAICAATE